VFDKTINIIFIISTSC